jgi:AraC-like DNA-binding protein
MPDSALHTAAVSADERFDFWRDVVSNTFVALHASRPPGGAFRGALRGARLGDLRIFEVDADPHMVRRTPRLIADSPGDYFKVGLLTQGHGLLAQDGRDTLLGPGDFAIYDTTRPYTFAFDGPFRMLVLIFPRDQLSLPPESVARVTATAISGGQGLGGLVGSFLVQASRVLDEVDARDHARLATNVLDLLTTALAGGLETRPGDPDSVHRALLLQTLAFIERHLCDPCLSPGAVASAHHISTRYLHKLFQAEGTTVSAWIRRRRLEHCRRDLRDPAHAQRSVSAIGARWGLPDASHFSRLFRAAFGVSPRDYRLCADAAAAGDLVGAAAAGSASAVSAAGRRRGAGDEGL